MNRILVFVLVVALIGVGGYSALTNTSAGQDFLLEQALEAQAAAALNLTDFNGLEVMVCGSSSPLPDPNRAQACIMVRAGNQMFWWIRDLVLIRCCRQTVPLTNCCADCC